jgi:hypothetical protein
MKFLFLHPSFIGRPRRQVQGWLDPQEAKSALLMEKTTGMKSTEGSRRLDLRAAISESGIV